MIFAALFIVIGAFGLIFPEICHTFLKLVCMLVFFFFFHIGFSFFKDIFPKTFREVEGNLVHNEPDSGAILLIRICAGVSVVAGILILISGG